jgi:hypothetical protein
MHLGPGPHAEGYGPNIASMANRRRAVELLKKAIQLGNGGGPEDFHAWREQSRVALRAAYGEGDRALERFDGISYGLMAFSESTPQSAWDRAQRVGVEKALAQLHAALIDVESEEADVPAVDIGGLHPWIAGMATSLWHGDHHRQAVEEAARSVEVQLRAKLKIDGGTSTSLISEAFSLKAPEEGKPRLRFSQYAPGSASWKNAHDGAANFGRGCVMRIRNLLVHGDELPEQEALESLAALSLLARWIDTATVDRDERSGS